MMDEEATKSGQCCVVKSFWLLDIAVTLIDYLRSCVLRVQDLKGTDCEPELEGCSSL